MTTRPSIRDCLSRTKPSVGCSVTTPASVGAGLDEDITFSIWGALCADNLEDNHSDVLNKPSASFPPPDAMPRDIENEVDVLVLVLRSSKVLNAAILATGIPCGVTIRNLAAETTNGRVDRPRLPRNLRRRVDHVVHQDTHTVRQDAGVSQTLFVGLGKSSRSFNCDQFFLSLQDGQPAIGQLQAVRQLADLCRISDTPFGYLQTELSTVWFAFHRAANDSLCAAVQRVLWSADTGLTTDLAMWWVTAMAAARRRGFDNVDAFLAPLPPSRLARLLRCLQREAPGWIHQMLWELGKKWLVSLVDFIWSQAS